VNQRPQGQSPNPALIGLMGKFDQDPGRYRPLYYGVEITVPTAVGGVGRGSISLNNQPFIWTRGGHQIVGDTADPSTTGLYQDGQYLIAFKDEQSNYQNQAIPAELLFGSVRSGYIVELAFPIAFAGNKTITFEITNRTNRALVPQADTYQVYIAMHGIADWGKLKPGG
jgi:hypothetical protein